MKFLSFYLLYGFLWLLTRLPIRFLYLISDLIFPLLYYLIPYRKKLVKKNMQNSFPEWNKKKVNHTARRFYSWLLDSMIESMLFSFLPEKEITKRYHFRNPEVCNELFEKGKSILLVMGHYGNWEWTSTLPLAVKHKVLAIYKPLHNPWYDRFIKNNREKYGVITVPMDKTLRVMNEYHQKKIPVITLFLADQRPRFAQIQYWTKFMNQDTPVILGPEKISVKFDDAVVFYNIIPVKRGHYEIEFDVLYENPRETKQHEITDAYFRRLERMIHLNPEYWLWTHHRWKHDKELYDKLKEEKHKE